MKKIVVVMSTYNGATVVTRQLDSIFSQKDVEPVVCIRDDGSKDNTASILKEYKDSIYPKQMFVDYGENVGWERSFLLALRNAPDADYYAFSDQDDLWFETKLGNAVKRLDRENPSLPILFHCNKLTVDSQLRPLKKQVVRLEQPLNRKNALMQEYTQGCSIVMNKAAKELVCRYEPREKIAHDFWCGLLCYLFGRIIYDDEKYFYHICYGSNASGEGHPWKSRFSRFKAFFSSKNIYRLPIDDLLCGYGDMLSADDLKFINVLKNYKYSFLKKIKLLVSTEFVRSSFYGTLSLKFAILMNRL